jgi:hypothetical protein
VLVGGVADVAIYVGASLVAEKDASRVYHVYHAYLAYHASFG